MVCCPAATARAEQLSRQALALQRQISAIPGVRRHLAEAGPCGSSSQQRRRQEQPAELLRQMSGEVHLVGGDLAQEEEEVEVRLVCWLVGVSLFARE